MKRTLALLFALLMLVAAAGCAAKPTATVAPTVAATVEATATPAPTPSPTPEPSLAAPPADLKDFLGNAVTLGKFPERIVSLAPSNTEILYALGLESKIVGVDAYSNYPEAANALTKVGDFNGPNLETIVSLKPDLVLAGNNLQADIIDKIKALGIPVASAEATTYEDIYKSIDLVAALTGTTEKAEAIKADMRAKEKLVRDAVASATGKTVYFAMSSGDAGNWTAGPGSFPYELIAMAGGKSITEGLGAAWINLSQEDLVKKDPDIILLSDMGIANADAFKTAEGYKDLKAVKGGQVFTVTSDLCTRPGPRIVEGLREYAQFINGITIEFPAQ